LSTALREHWDTFLTPRKSAAASDDGLRIGQRDPNRPGPTEDTPGRATDPRTVEAQLPQLVPADQQDLLPALSFLLRSHALASALAQPTAADASRIASRLQAEVQTLYSPAICQRLQGVIEGLVGMPEPTVAVPAGPVSTPAPPPLITTVGTSGGGGGGWVVALLCFLIGIMGSGLGLLLWLQHQNKQPAASSVVPAAPPAAQAPRLSPPPPPATSARLQPGLMRSMPP
jgi:hypothetical protein